ncbi:MAG: hypothetical protein QOJ29_2347 [Thermoleophilaceae bacterium]|nr:hypothetical protein [Thermoleophilaceae bacterium]
MRSPVDLVELPYTFTQLRPLMPDDFLSEARARDFHVGPDGLEALHRARLLVPFLRAGRDGRAIRRLARSGDALAAHQVSRSRPTDRQDLADLQQAGRLRDPAAEPFMSRDRRRRPLDDTHYLTSEYLYSHHQLIALPAIRPAIPYLSRNRRGVSDQLDPMWLQARQTDAAFVRELAVAASALEPVYYPDIVRSLKLGPLEDYTRYEQWRARLRPLAILKWLDVKPDWLSATAARLLSQADRIDPLGRWSNLIREADPDRWTLLRHDARSAIDLRIAAEILLRYHDRLVRARRARALQQRQGRLRGEFDSRLKPQGGVDGLLTDFGLSPHPSVVLVIEGHTERMVIPRLMAKFGIRQDRDYIAIENMEGVDRNLAPLVAYLAPRTEPEEDGRYLRPLLPLTRIVVVTDAEGKLETTDDRARLRRKLVGQLVRTLPREHQTQSVREALETLVHVETWTPSGLSFEFAHFTNPQLARAIDDLDPRPQKPSVRELIQRVGSVRRSKGNLEHLLHRGSKRDLAERLWPVLEKRIDREIAAGTERRVPVVRVLDRAIELAHEIPRRGIVIPLR